MKDQLLSFYNYFFNYKEILRRKRLVWIDYAKGVAIFLVVYHHAFIGLESSGVSVNSWLINTNMIVYSFRVPLFFILSGLFIKRGLSKRGLKKYIFYRSRILLYPYILWAFLQITISYFVQPYINFPWHWQSYLYLLYEPKSTGQLWYLLALFNASILYVIVNTKLKIGDTGQVIFAVILYILVPLVIFNSMLQELFINYIYLVLGTVISKFILNDSNKKYLASYKTFLMLIPLFIFSQIYWLHHESLNPYFLNYGHAGISFPWLLSTEIGLVKYITIVIIGCIFTINVCFLLQKHDSIPFLKVIGFHSLYIYLMHIIFEASIRTVFLHLFNIHSAFIILPSQVILSVIGSIMLYNLLIHFNLKILFEYDSNYVKTFFSRWKFYPTKYL